MLAEKLNDIDEALLQQVCADRWSEAGTLDIKQVLPGNDKADKLEFCKDVAAMANADGGDIVYGISEKDGAAHTIIPICTENADKAIRRLMQTLEAGVEPRVSGVKAHDVPTGAGYCLVIRVPASFDGPHRIQDNRFVMRTGRHTLDLSYDQLRNAFGRTSTLVERAREFITKRRLMIAQGETNDIAKAHPICTAHLILLSGLAGRYRPSINDLQTDYAELRFPDWSGGASYKLNLDGVRTYPGGDGPRITYAQAFRDGALEGVRNGKAQHEDGLIYASTVTQYFRDALQRFVAAAIKQGATGPAIFSAAMLRVTDYTFHTGRAYNQMNRAVADRSDLLLPEVWIESIEDMRDIDAYAKPLLDVLWQAFGLGSCHEYDPHGKWTGG